MKRIRHIALAMAATMVLSSCSLFRDYERSTELPAADLFGGLRSGDGEQSTGAAGWREFFTDPTLQALIEQALSQNASLRQIDLQIQEAQQYLMCSKLAYIPSLAIAPQGQLSSHDWSSPLRFYTIPLSASWQLGSIGSLRNAKKKAEVGVEQVKAARQAVQQSLVANVANLYYTLCMLDAQVAISEQTASNWRESVERSRQLMAAGRSNKAAVAQTEANCLSVESSLLDLKQARVEAENALCTLLGEAPHHIERTSLDTFHVPTISTGVPMQLLDNRPDVRQAELKLASAFYDVNSAKANFYPSLTISGTLGYTNNGSTAELDPAIWIWNAVAQLAQPIFQNGRLIAAKRVAVMQQQEAQIAFVQALVAAGNEVNTALTALQTAQGKTALVSGQVRALTDAAQATEALYYNSPGVNYLNVLTAQTGLLSAQLGEVANRFALIQATIDLYQALGGGSGSDGEEQSAQ